MGKHLTMKEMPDTARPYEKFLSLGPEALNEAELLAIMIRTGAQGTNTLELMEQILNLSPYRQGILSLHRLTMDELKKLKGIGQIKAMQLKCIGELSKRMAKMSAEKRLNFSSPSSIAAYYMEDLRHAGQEHMILVMLDTKNRLIADQTITKGTVNASLASPREIFLEALRSEAVAIILLHNHPSGDPSPSREDIIMTKQIREAGQLIGIHLLDHIIIGDNKFMSFHEQGIL